MKTATKASSWAHLNSPLVPLIIVAVAYVAFLSARLAAHDYDPSVFVMAGDESCDPARVSPSLTVEPRSAGYDGQWYYRLALDPFLTQATDHGVRLPNPAYRQQRLLYPLVVRLLSLGRPSLVPPLLILVNLLALCLMGWVGGAYSQSLGRHALWGIAFALYPGFLLSLSRDLTEILEVSLLLSGLLLLRRERHFWAALLLTLAVLTRETAMLVVAGGFLLWLWACGTGGLARPWGSPAGKPGAATCPDGKRAAWPVVLIPLATFLLWQGLLFLRWGQFGLGASARRLCLPFSGLVDACRENAAAGPLPFLWLGEVVLLLVLAVAVLASFRASAASAMEKVSWALSAVLALFLSRAVWVEDWAFLRAVSEFYVLGAIILLGSPSRWRWFIFPWSLALWGFLSVTRVP
jgi:hypothetical protein